MGKSGRAVGCRRPDRASTCCVTLPKPVCLLGQCGSQRRDIEDGTRRCCGCKPVALMSFSLAARTKSRSASRAARRS